MNKGVLKEINQTPSLAQRLSGGVVAANLTRSDNPPLSSDKLGYYLAALEGKAPDPSKARIARALTWADNRTKVYRRAFLDWYALAGECFPDDERCAFYVAALHHHGLRSAPEAEVERIFGRIMRPDWRESPSWSRLEIVRAEIIQSLMTTYADVPDDDQVRITPERIPVLEAAFDNNTLSHETRLAVARSLAVAYRAVQRSDERAEIIYRFLFLHCPQDRENNLFLAQLFHGLNRMDLNASVVYSRMVMQATEDHDEPTRLHWSLRLAKTYLALDQITEVSIPVFIDALKAEPENRRLEAALVYAAARSEQILDDEFLLRHLESALAFESELVPIFQEHQWPWGAVPRALALAWGKAGRRDTLASFIYSRATEFCPEDKVLWGYYATALAQANDTSRRAITIYERASRYQQASDEVLAILGQAYLENRVQDGTERRKALLVWESLLRQGKGSYAINAALAEAYIREDRINDAGIELLAHLSQTDAASGALLMRVAQEYRERGEFNTALRWYMEAERRAPSDFQMLYEYGMLLKTQFSDFAGAVTLLSRAILQPQASKNLEVHSALGECLLALGNREDARRVFQLIVDRIDASHAPTLLHLARLNLKYEETGVIIAEALYDQAAQLDPNNPETYKRMADMYRETGDDALAEQALERYLQLSGAGDANRYRQLADLYIRRKDYAKAEGALRQVIYLGQASTEIYKLLGDVVSRKKAS